MVDLRAGLRPKRMKTLRHWRNGPVNGMAQMEHDCSCALKQSIRKKKMVS